jgi:hypothetical protein
VKIKIGSNFIIQSEVKLIVKAKVFKGKVLSRRLFAWLRDSLKCDSGLVPVNLETDQSEIRS